MNWRYLLSMPERLLRALAASVGGLVYEASQVLLPGWLRRSRLYQAIVYRLLRLTVELVGGVQNVLPPDQVEVGELAKRKAAGNVIELASFLAVGWSPLWLLAAAADLTGGTRVYLRALVDEIQRQGLLPGDVDITSVEDLLNSLEGSSGLMADLIDVPPLNVHQLRTSWQAMQENAGSLPNPARLAGIFNQLQQVAQTESRSLQSVSSLVALSAVRAGIRMGNAYIFDYYQEALGAIQAEGWSAYVKRAAKPYLAAAVSHFDSSHETFTERLLLRLAILRRRLPARRAK